MHVVSVKWVSTDDAYPSYADVTMSDGQVVRYWREGDN